MWHVLIEDRGNRARWRWQGMRGRLPSLPRSLMTLLASRISSGSSVPRERLMRHPGYADAAGRKDIRRKEFAFLTLGWRAHS
jgi:hypothetical protein